jgi:membrane-associated protein
MEFIHTIIDFILHLDVHLELLMGEYQLTSYAILFGIIFCETGLVIWPFLPGDSLLFAAGAIIAKSGILNVWVLIPLLMLAAFLGDNTNYFFGKTLGQKVFTRDFWFLKRKYITQTEAFYEKHGGKTLIMARFVPIVRTFAPFVAGIGSMNYATFIKNSIIGAFLWVPTLTLAGYFFGQIPIIKNNFELVIFGILGLSVLPVIYGIFKGRKEN